MSRSDPHGSMTVVGDTTGVDASALPGGVPIGQSVGRYVAIEEVGRGAMGVVLRAYDPKLQREVALKVVSASRLSAEAHARMIREARAMAKLSHPNVVAVYDVELDTAGGVVVAMELARGPTLREWATWSPSPALVLARFIEAGRGLAAAHDAGLLHRDFKPSNVLVGGGTKETLDAGRSQVTDFGLARGLEERDEGDGISREARDDIDLSSGLTSIGTVMGTPSYMPPEQHLGQELTPAADQYAFCVSLWEGLTGDLPFEGGTLAELAVAKRRGPPPWPGNVAVSKAVVVAIRRGLAISPSERWPSMADLLDALGEAAVAAARRRRMVALAGGGGVVALAAVAVFGARNDAACQGAADALAQAWSDARRIAISESFHATGMPFAEAELGRVHAELDAYGQRWVQVHTEACEATAVRGEQSSAVLDLRMACLRRARMGLVATADVFADADDEVVLRAKEVLGGLPSLDRCEDVDALQADVEPPAAEDAEAVEAVRERLSEADARRNAGRFDAAFESWQAADDAATDIGYDPVRTELALARGRIDVGRGEYDDAESALEEALRRALVWDQFSIASRASIDLVYVVGVKLERTDAALALVPIAEGLVERSGDPLARADLQTHTASVWSTTTDYAHAEELHRQALAIKLEQVGPEHRSVAASRNNLALALDKQGKHDEALQEHRRAMEIRRKALGDRHPEVADSRHNIAMTLGHKREFEEALEEYRAALQMQVGNLGPDHPHIATYRANYARTLDSLGRKAEAVAQLRTALSILITTFGNDHRRVADARTNLGGMLLAMDRYDEGEEQYREALETRQRLFGTQHQDVAAAHNNVGYLWSAQGNQEEALEHYTLAVEIGERTFPDADPALAQIRHNLGRLRYELGDVAAGRRLLEASWRVREDDEPRRARRAETAYLLARARWDTGDRVGALEVAREALADFEADGNDHDSREVAAWLADAEREYARDVKARRAP